jgi:large subunit ribosomal protein L10
VVKNTLTERAADEAGERAQGLKTWLTGPTALTFVRGDAATAAKAISQFNRETDLLAFKGGILNGDTLEVEQIQAIARLPSRDVLYQQFVGVVASPITGVVRGLNALISGLALQLGQIAEKKASGEIPAAAAEAPDQAAEAPEQPVAAEAPADEAPETPETPASDNDNDSGASA